MVEKEDVLHMLCCSDPKSIRIWNKSLWDYITYLHKIHTCSRAIIAIMKELQAWREQLPHPNIDSLSPSLYTVISNQQKIGWKQFLEGLLAEEWIEYQHDHYLQINLKKSGLIWSKKIIWLHVNLLQKIWAGQNNQLHKTKMIHEMEGLPEHIRSICTEWTIGINTLPTVDFSHLFSTPLEALLQKTIDTEKDWLAVIKLGRKLHNDPNINIDNFSGKGPLADGWASLMTSGWMTAHKQFQFLASPTKIHQLQKNTVYT
jgi:hypothetical protein